MLSNFNRYILILTLIICFTACDEDILKPNEFNDYTPNFVVNGILESGKPFSLQLTNSTSVTSSELPKLVTNAMISLGHNSNSVTMTYDQTSQRYISNVVPQPGDRISLDIRSSGSGLPNANAIELMPKSISAISVLIPEGGRDSSGILSDLLRIKFQDDPSGTNYYKINFYYFDKTLGIFIPMAFATNDPSLAEYNSYHLNDGSIIFDDALFNGKEKEISTVAPFGLVLSNPAEKYLIRLESISSSYFKYTTSLQRAKDAQEATFTSAFNNAVVIYSNINNGLGILGSTYAVRDTLY